MSSLALGAWTKRSHRPKSGHSYRLLMVIQLGLCRDQGFSTGWVEYTAILMCSLLEFEFKLFISRSIKGHSKLFNVLV